MLSLHLYFIPNSSSHHEFSSLQKPHFLYPSLSPSVILRDLITPNLEHKAYKVKVHDYINVLISFQTPSYRHVSSFAPTLKCTQTPHTPFYYSDNTLTTRKIVQLCE